MTLTTDVCWRSTLCFMLFPCSLNRSTPLIAGAAMSIPADLSMRYAMYTLEKQYTRWGAVFPGNASTSAHMEGQVLTSEGKTCSRRMSFTNFQSRNASRNV